MNYPSFFLSVFCLVFLASCASPPVATPVLTYVVDHGSLSVHFCPSEPCEKLLDDFLSSAHTSLHCALYDFNLHNTSIILHNLSTTLDVRIVIDEDNQKKLQNLSDIPFVVDHGGGLMHNKFCVADGHSLFTGSMNPTLRDTTMNNNNLIFISSDFIAQQYELEFYVLWNQSKKIPHHAPQIILDDIPVGLYFCPKDDCADKVVQELRKAQRSIFFMTFSFTHHGIGNALLSKMNQSVEVKGVFEKTQLNDFTLYPVLRFQGADVRLDGNKYNMHHKVFIIDNETVITGSFNPTKNADERNDENLLIIKDKKIAEQFLEEFFMVFSSSPKH